MATRKRANNAGTVYPHRDKFRAQFTTPAGNRTSKVFDTEADAHAWILAQRAEAANNFYIEPSQITLGQWIQEYIATYCNTLRPKTVLGYVQTGKRLFPLANIPLQKLTAPGLQKFFNEVDMSDAGKQRAFRFLKQILNKAAAVDMLRKNPAAAVKPPQYTKQEIEIFTADEVKQILAAVSISKHYKKYYPLLLFTAYSGCRIGEVLGLKIHNVYEDRVKIDNARVTIPKKSIDTRPKTEAGRRDITLPSFVIEELRRAYQYPQPSNNGGYVFHTVNGTALLSRNLERIWENILEEASIPKKHFHALRHTHATQLLAAGVPLLEVSHRLGHSRPSHTLNLYGHAIKGYDTRIASTVTTIFGDGCTQNCTQEDKKA